jgi:hypothetical protein
MCNHVQTLAETPDVRVANGCLPTHSVRHGIIMPIPSLQAGNHF